MNAVAILVRTAEPVSTEMDLTSAAVPRVGQEQIVLQVTKKNNMHR